MNSDEMWLLQLWSGTFGATIGAVLAAGVALLVVTLTNKHQNRMAKSALEGQRADLQRQINEQRAESSRNRGTAAIADLLPELGEIESATNESKVPTSFELVAFRHRLTTAVSRWRLEIDSLSMFNELQHWPELLYRLARRTVQGEGDARLNWVELIRGTEALRSAAMAWYKSDVSGQEGLAQLLKAQRVLLDPLLSNAETTEPQEELESTEYDGRQTGKLTNN